MGVYTYEDKTLGLSLNNRLKKIVRAYQNGEALKQDDIQYLINNAARFSTLEDRISKETYKIDGMMLDQQYEIKDVLGDLITELRYMEAHRVGQDGTYRMKLPHFPPDDECDIERLPYERVQAEVAHAKRMVKDLQVTFDENEDNLKVVAEFENLKKHYGLDLLVTTESNVEDMLKTIIDKVTGVIEKEARQKEAILKRLTQPK